MVEVAGHESLIAPVVRLLTCDGSLVAQLSTRLEAEGISVEAFASAAALARASPQPNSVLLVDTGVLAPGQTVSALIAALPAPGMLLGLARSRDLAVRLDALRAGARSCFVSPVDTEVLAARLIALAGAPAAEPQRVLVVDDQPIAADFACRVLQGAGMRTEAVGDPMLVLEAIERFRPDLVLMDLHMPGASGLELTSLIRDHEEFGELPVVFLSAELNLGVQIEALRIGGDDFIAKPVPPGRLIDTVRQRIAASRRTGSAAAPGRDPVTGLRTRDALLRRIARAIADGGARPGTGLVCLACPAEGEASRAQLQAEAAEVLARRAGPGEVLGRCDADHLGLFATRADAQALDALASALAGDLAAAGISAAVGIGRLDPPASDPLTVLSRGRSACGRAGTGGDPAVTPAAQRQPFQFSGSDLAEAMDRLELLYQPIVTLRRSLGAPYEVSVRIPQPDGEYVSLDRSVAAEDQRLWVDADRRVLEGALDALRRWHPSQPGLRFFVPQSVRGTAHGGWTDWLREQILARELVRYRPVIQYDLADVAAEGGAMARRLESLRRLGIRVCLNGVDDSERVFDVIGGVPGLLVRLAKGTAALDVKALTALVQAFHEHEVEVISAEADNPQAIARVWSAGVDYIQGGLLQLPAAEPSFDFSEIRIG